LELLRQLFVLASKVQQSSSEPSYWLSLSYVSEMGGGIAVVIRLVPSSLVIIAAL
jgi:hypothetical protein